MGPHRRRVGDIATLEIYILLAVAPAGGGRFDCYPSRTGRYTHSGDILSNAATLETCFVAVTPAGQDNAATLEIYCQMQLHSMETYFVAVTPAGGRDVLTVTPAGQDLLYSHIGDIFWLLLQQEGEMY